MQDVWAVAEGHEIGDLCQGAGGTIEKNFHYSRIWSISAAAAGRDPCVPSLSGPYVNVSTPFDWKSVSAGESVMVPLTGWSSEPTADWKLQAGIRASSRGGFSANLGATTINNGTQVTLSIGVPADAVSGDYAVVRLLSTQPASSDESAIWVAGVYVP
jgi:hypothetical protein